MNPLKTAAFGLAVVAFSVGGFAPAASAMHMTASENKTMNSCMAMPGDGMMGDAHCKRMMRRMKISNAHMKMMMSCRAMSKDDMMKNTGCMRMSKMHPTMMHMDAM